MKETIIVIYQAADEPPNPESKGKFIQITLGEREYLVFAPFSLHLYHNQILAQFVRENDIAHRWVRRDSLVVDDPDLQVIGGGRFHVDEQHGILKLSDNSQAYGRFNDRGMAEKIAASKHAWSRYKIVIF